MKKRIAIIIMVMLLAMSITACGGKDTEGIENMSGLWKLETIEQNGEVTNILEYESLGLFSNLTLNEDMTLDFDMLGEQTTGTWKAKSADSMSMTVDGSGRADGKLIDGKLIMEDGESKLVFIRG